MHGHRIPWPERTSLAHRGAHHHLHRRDVDVALVLVRQAQQVLVSLVRRRAVGLGLPPVWVDEIVRLDHQAFSDRRHSPVVIEVQLVTDPHTLVAHQAQLS